MKKLNIYSWSMLLLMTLVVSACSDDDDNGSNAIECTQTALAEALSDQLQGYTDALFDYLGDQSSENCNALKSSSEEYVQFYKDNKDCIEKLSDGVVVDDEIDELELGLDSLDC